MSKQNLAFAKSSDELIQQILKILKIYRDKQAYIVDRNKCTNFMSIFRDGISSYSNIDLFCERLFTSHIVTMLEKEIYDIDDMDKSILEYYNEAVTYIKEQATNPELIDKKQFEHYQMVIHDLDYLVKNIQPITKKLKMPFYINPTTKEEFPLIHLKDASDEVLQAWAQQLAMFCEVAKTSLTPAAFSEHMQPDGLCVMQIQAVLWTDIVIR